MSGDIQPHPQASELTERILRCGLAGDWPGAGALIGQVYHLGARAMVTLLYLVADYHIAAHEQVFGRREIDRPVWLDVPTGRVVVDADEMAPGQRWAGRFVTARAAGDRETCVAQLGVLAGLSHERFTACVAALVETCVHMLHMAPCTCGKHT